MLECKRTQIILHGFKGVLRSSVWGPSISAPHFTHLLRFIQGFVKGEEFCWSYSDFFSMNLSLSNQITHTDIVNQSEASKSELVSSCLYMKVNEASLLNTCEVATKFTYHPKIDP